MKRCYSLDLLRVLSMFMIVTLHSTSHGIPTVGGVNFYTVWFHFITALSVVSVNVFVLISGYFLINENFRLSKIWKLMAEVLFYSWLFGVLRFVIIKDFSDITIKNIISAFLPISYSEYWFVSAYVVMYILSPVINLLLNNITQKQHFGTMSLLLLCFCLWSDVLPFSLFQGGYSFIWFVCLYVVAAYFRKYIPTDTNKKKSMAIYLVSCLILFFFWLFCSYFLPQNSNNVYIAEITHYYYNYNSILVFLGSISLFQYFRGLKVNNTVVKNILKFVTPLVFGVYLIHDNPNMRDYVWAWLRNSHFSFYEYPFIAFLYVAFIFLTCLIVDYFRSLLFSLVNRRALYIKSLSFLDNYIRDKFDKVYSSTLTL